MANLNSVIFSGGRGCANIIKSLLRQTEFDLTIAVNAYDNGKSTGSLRKYIPGLLGPSDIRKNVSTLLEFYERQMLCDFLEFRLKNQFKNKSLLSFIEDSQQSNFALLTVNQYKSIVIAVEHFEKYQRDTGIDFDTSDCAIGNILIAGLFLKLDRNFNLTVDEYQKIFLPENSRAQVINVTNGENLYLIARSRSGKLFMDEAQIVINEGAESIREIALVADTNLPIDEKTFKEPTKPKMNMKLREKLKNMEVLIYGPGTQASSLLPSYLTEGVLSEIANNLTAKKIFISNLIPDYDDPVSNVISRLETFFQLIDRVNPGLSQTSYVTNVFSELNQVDPINYILTEKFPELTFQTDNWLTDSNKHLGAAIVRQISNTYQDIYRFKPGFVTLIVNNKNNIVNFDEYSKILIGMTKNLEFGVEIIVVNKSTLNSINPYSFENQVITKKINGKFYLADSISKALIIARGDLIVYLECKDLYSVTDILRGISLFDKGGTELAIGSRNLKLFDLRDQIKDAYPNQPIRGYISYFGSLLISLSFLLRFRRFISDPLAGVKVFRKSTLSDGDLRKIGQDININLLKYFIARGAVIEQFNIDFHYEKLSKSNRNSIKQGIYSLARIWASRNLMETKK